MTTFTVDVDVETQKTHFKDLEEMFDVLYEEFLEMKAQRALREGEFIDY